MASFSVTWIFILTYCNGSCATHLSSDVIKSVWRRIKTSRSLLFGLAFTELIPWVLAGNKEKSSIFAKERNSIIHLKHSAAADEANAIENPGEQFVKKAWHSVTHQSSRASHFKMA